MSQFRDTDCKFQMISKLNWSKSNMNQLLLCTLQITTECFNAILPWLWLFHRTEWSSYASPHWSIWIKTVDHWTELNKLYMLVPLHGTGILVAQRIGSDIQNNYIGRSLPIAITRTLTFIFLQWLHEIGSVWEERMGQEEVGEVQTAWPRVGSF